MESTGCVRQLARDIDGCINKTPSPPLSDYHDLDSVEATLALSWKKWRFDAIGVVSYSLTIHSLEHCIIVSQGKSRNSRVI
jgi:hypothetical protein